MTLIRMKSSIVRQTHLVANIYIPYYRSSDNAIYQIYHISPPSTLSFLTTRRSEERFASLPFLFLLMTLLVRRSVNFKSTNSSQLHGKFSLCFLLVSIIFLFWPHKIPQIECLQNQTTHSLWHVWNPSSIRLRQVNQLNKPIRSLTVVLNLPSHVLGLQVVA